MANGEIKRWVIVNPEIVSEPDYRCGHGGTVTENRRGATYALAA
jgi:hypothetical protein